MLKFVIAIHIIVCLALIVIILLQSGRGTGLSSAFGGGLPSTFSGSTLIERNLFRITVALAIIFGVTSIILYIFAPR
ncbi:MAG: preprotein translocase subunit SecG [Actinomycetota bacterium]|nr:preprotein translocase subunit SecG [Actinomycetota bacterium]MDI6822734.1 preprotein translocase subunit SecG [Actinomycetota bacterium]